VRVRAHKANLRRTSGALGDDALGPAFGGLDADVRCRPQAEGHHVFAPLGDFGLALGVGGVNGVSDEW
jgi:hypothetical protein